MRVCSRARPAELASMPVLALALEAEEEPLHLLLPVRLVLVPRRLQIGSVVRWILMRSCIVWTLGVPEACLVLGCWSSSIDSPRRPLVAVSPAATLHAMHDP